MQQVIKLSAQFILCLILTTLLYCTSRGQTQNDRSLLLQKIQSADSVVLISHQTTAEYGGKIVPDWDIRNTSMSLSRWHELHPPLPSYLIAGKLNRAIIKESLSLNESDRTNLSEILLRNVFLERITFLKCDEPRHSIIIYHGREESYIDICFGCKRIHTSKDIDFSEFYMDERKWTELKYFFKKSGLTKLFVDPDD